MYEQNRKPFNLEDAKAGMPVVTREGLKVLELHHFTTEEVQYCVAAMVEGHGLKLFTEHGLLEVEAWSPLDLFMTTVDKQVFVNFYDDGIATYFDTEEQARRVGTSNDNAFLVAAAIPVTLKT
jgi:hypothetical protein